MSDTSLDARLLDQCVGCGLCLPACPTYQVLGLEMDSPRGRIDFVRGVAQGRIPFGEGVARHLDRCLDCRACESACPSGVRYGRIIEDARAVLGRPPGERGAPARRLRSWLLRRLLPSRGALRALAAALELWRASGLHALARRALGPPGGGGLRARLAWAARLLPRARGRPFAPRAAVVAPAGGGPRRARVALFRGCVQDVLFGDVQRATVRALARAGCEVVIPPGQTCCGALLLHTGDRATARALAARNVDAFADAARTLGGAGAPFDAVVVNAAGCGSALAEAGDLVGTEPARAFAARVRDVTEVLADLAATGAATSASPTPACQAPGAGARLGPDAPRTRRIAYQDPCHLRHARRVRAAPRALLAALPGVELVEPAGVDTCCGSAGIYNLLQPELSRELTERKAAALLATGAEVVATGNPGCLLQIESALAPAGIAVVHPVELLDAAASGASGGALAAQRPPRPRGRRAEGTS